MENKNLFSYINNVELDERMKRGLISAGTRPVTIEAGGSHWKNFAVLGGVAAVLCAGFVSLYVFVLSGNAPLSEVNPESAVEEARADEDSPFYAAGSVVDADEPWATTMTTMVSENDLILNDESDVDEYEINEDDVKAYRILDEGSLPYYNELIDTVNGLRCDNPLGFGIIPYFEPENEHWGYFVSYIANWEANLRGEETELYEIDEEQFVKYLNSVENMTDESRYPRIEELEANISGIYSTLHDYKNYYNLSIHAFIPLDYNDSITLNDGCLFYRIDSDLQFIINTWNNFTNSLFADGHLPWTVDDTFYQEQISDTHNDFVEQDGKMYAHSVDMDSIGYIYYTIGDTADNVQWIYCASSFELFKLIYLNDSWKIAWVGNIGSGTTTFIQDANGDWFYAKG